MRKLNLDIINKINELTDGQPNVDGALRAVDLAEVLDYAAAYGFETEHIRQNLNANLSFQGAPSIPPVSIAEKIHMARFLDTLKPDGGYEAKEMARLERLNAVYGVNGSDYDPIQSLPIEATAQPC